MNEHDETNVNQNNAKPGSESSSTWKDEGNSSQGEKHTTFKKEEDKQDFHSSEGQRHHLSTPEKEALTEPASEEPDNYTEGRERPSTDGEHQELTEGHHTDADDVQQKPPAETEHADDPAPTQEAQDKNSSNAGEGNSKQEVIPTEAETDASKAKDSDAPVVAEKSETFNLTQTEQFKQQGKKKHRHHSKK